jgi:hypothetical protein
MKKNSGKKCNLANSDKTTKKRSLTSIHHQSFYSYRAFIYHLLFYFIIHLFSISVLLVYTYGILGYVLYLQLELYQDKTQRLIPISCDFENKPIEDNLRRIAYNFQLQL